MSPATLRVIKAFGITAGIVLWISCIVMIPVLFPVPSIFTIVGWLWLLFSPFIFALVFINLD